MAFLIVFALSVSVSVSLLCAVSVCVCVCVSALLCLYLTHQLTNSHSLTIEYQLFLQNVFTELDGMEYRLACSHDGSALLETFLRVATPFHLAVFFDRLAGKYEGLAGHRYGSHVLETVLEASGRALAAGDTGLRAEAANEGLLPLDRQLVRAYEELKSSIIDAVHDAYGSHVWRALVNTLAQAAAAAAQSQSQSQSSCTDTLADLGRSLLEMDEAGNSTGQGFRDLAVEQHAAPFLQALLVALNRTMPALTGKIIARMLHGFHLVESAPQQQQSGNDSAARAAWLALMQHEIGSRTAEAIIGVLPAAGVQTLYASLVRGSATDLLTHPAANFPLQRLVTAFRNSAQLQLFLDEVRPLLPEVIGMRRFGILLRAAEWAVEHKDAHELVFNAVLDTFRLGRAPEDRQLLFKCCLYLQVHTKSDFKESRGEAHGLAQSQSQSQARGLAQSQANTHSHSHTQASAHSHSHTGNNQTSPNPQGCALLCLLARFPAKTVSSVVDGLLKCSEAEILALARSPSGSRVLEAFFTGGAVGPKALQRIGRHLKGHLGSVACDKYGSHVVECLWKHSPLQAKNSMMEELSACRERLESSQYGRMVVRTCRLNQYTRHREDWIKEEQGKATKRSLFEDIING